MASVVTGSFSGDGEHLKNVSASYIAVANIDGTPLSATSASFASASITSSFAVTASYVELSGLNPTKRGIVNGSAFSNNPKTAKITFTSSFVDNNYSIVVSAESLRLFSIQNKDSGSFEINSNEDVAFTENVFWNASYCGE